jgi:hypothetical protein
MKFWKEIVIFVLALFVVAAAYGYYKFTAPEMPIAVMDHFRSLKEVELCSMDPADSSVHSRTDYGKGEIEGFHIVDTTLVNPNMLLDALDSADRANNRLAAACFWPRHAIRDPNNHENYLLICFKCYQVIYSFAGESETVLITDAPRDLFDSVIDEQGMDRYAGPKQ